MRLYLDNCCFNRPFDDQTQLKISLESQAKLAVQDMILKGKHSLIWSYILEYENMNNPFELRKDSIGKWKDLAEKNILANDEIIKLAEALVKKGLKPKDALHIACASYADCDYFITTDAGILKKHIEVIKTINPIDFISETEVDQ